MKNASAASCHQGYYLYFAKRMKVDPDSFGVEHRIPRGYGVYCPGGFKLLPGEVSLEVINRVLVRLLGHDEVSPRTFGNYRANWMEGRKPADYKGVNRTDYGVDNGPLTDEGGAFTDRGRAE